jgi:hypothetical protein
MKKLCLSLITVIGFSAGVFALSSHAVKSPSAWIDGTWSGTGYQIDSGDTWQIELEADSALGIYSVNYPDLNCRGRWKTELVDGYSAVFIEKIEKGDHCCVDGGLIKISKIDANHISFSFFWDDGSIGAFSTLVRKRLHEKMNRFNN